MASTPSPISAGEERFFALSLDLLTVVGFDGRFKRFNAAWERELGWTEEELKARPWPEFVHPDDREASVAEAARLTEPGAVTRDFELRFATRDGGWRSLLISARGFQPEQAIYVVAKDITDRKRAEGAQSHSEERFRAVTESVNDAIVSADGDGRIVLWNPAAARTFGYTAEEAIGMPTADLVPDRFREAWLDGFRRLREGAGEELVGRTVELPGRRQDGTELVLELSIGEWRADERPYFTGVIRDVTDRRRTESYLEAQHAVERVLVESPPVRQATSRVLAALGEAMGWAAGAFWELDGEALHCRAFWSAQAGETGEFEAQTRAPARRGEGVPGLVLERGEPAWLPGAVGVPVTSGGGDVVGVLEFFTPNVREPDDELTSMMSAISAQVGEYMRRKQAEEALETTAGELRRRAAELEKSNAELEQFAYVASHDLSEPLRMISGFVQLLSERYTGRLDADADEFIAYTIDGVERMQGLITDLLAYSRVGREVEDGPVDLSEVVDDALAALRAPVSERGAEVDVGELPVVCGDRRELTQLFQNLLSNAVKFVAEGTPRVEVRAHERDGGMWALSVRDNGIGIEPRHAERIFKMFQRLHGRDDYPGTGIGLAICKKIVERHGGAIDVAPAEGGGSVFTVTLPADRSAA